VSQQPRTAHKIVTRRNRNPPPVNVYVPVAPLEREMNGNNVIPAPEVATGDLDEIT
jgi:hypothetical protein